MVVNILVVMRVESLQYAYLREDLKAMDLNPDILAQQDKNQDNPHKTKHIDLNDKALGRTGKI